MVEGGKSGQSVPVSNADPPTAEFARSPPGPNNTPPTPTGKPAALVPPNGASGFFLPGTRHVAHKLRLARASAFVPKGLHTKAREIPLPIRPEHTAFQRQRCCGGAVPAGIAARPRPQPLRGSRSLPVGPWIARPSQPRASDGSPVGTSIRSKVLGEGQDCQHKAARHLPGRRARRRHQACRSRPNKNRKKNRKIPPPLRTSRNC